MSIENPPVGSFHIWANEVFVWLLVSGLHAWAAPSCLPDCNNVCQGFCPLSAPSLLVGRHFNNTWSDRQSDW